MFWIAVLLNEICKTTPLYKNHKHFGVVFMNRKCFMRCMPTNWVTGFRLFVSHFFLSVRYLWKFSFSKPKYHYIYIWSGSLLTLKSTCPTPDRRRSSPRKGLGKNKRSASRAWWVLCLCNAEYTFGDSYIRRQKLYRFLDRHDENDVLAPVRHNIAFMLIYKTNALGASGLRMPYLCWDERVVYAIVCSVSASHSAMCFVAVENVLCHFARTYSRLQHTH